MMPKDNNYCDPSTSPFLGKGLYTKLFSFIKIEFFCRIIAHCIKRRLLWRTSFVRKVCREGEYYEDMMRYLRKNLAVGIKESFLVLLIVCMSCLGCVSAIKNPGFIICEILT